MVALGGALLVAALALEGDGASAAPTDTPAGAGTPVPNTGVTVMVTDSGFQPSQLSIPPGTQVNWVNRGSRVHSATSDTGAWNSGSLNPNQWNSFVFNDLGQYPYHSDNDVTLVPNGDGTTTRTYNLTGSVAVMLTATPTITPTPAPPAFAAVTIVDGAFQPGTVTVAVGATVTWTNTGTTVHTATSDFNLPWWDTGGLSSGQFATIRFDVPGAYAYHSGTDGAPPGTASDASPLLRNYYAMRGQVTVVQVPWVATPTPIQPPAVLVNRS